jgi:hypothetical protein
MRWSGTGLDFGRELAHVVCDICLTATGWYVTRPKKSLQINTYILVFWDSDDILISLIPILKPSTFSFFKVCLNER